MSKVCTHCYAEVEDDDVACPRCGWVELQADDPGPDAELDPEYDGEEHG